MSSTAPHRFSTVSFKSKKADLRKKSPRILAVSTIISVVLTTAILHIAVNPPEKKEAAIAVAPVIMKLDNIPETRHRIETPAPPKPVVNNGIPIEVMDDLIPEDITIEDTTLETETVSTAKPSVFLPSAGDVSEAENEIYEYFAVEEPPKRTKLVAPEYPVLAERAGIEGTVTLKMLISVTGTVDSVLVVDGPSAFHKSSIDAARKTEFTPARHNDRAVPCWILLPFRYVLDR